MVAAQEIAQLEAAIAAQEALRPALGDAVVEVTLQALRARLERLRAPRAGSGPLRLEAASEQLISRLQSYIPRELAEKMRATGRIEGERKQVTVLFADISGFTALSERLDPEEVAALANEALKELAGAVYLHEGYIDKFVGDAVMAVFGAPVAHEDDPERALRAALSMRERMESFNRRQQARLGEPLSLHIGINTGLVVAGNVGSDLRLSYTVMGDTVNTASRLEDAAGPGQILVSHETFRATRAAFTFRDMPPITVKGKREPLTVYELLRARLLPDKIRGVSGLARVFVGREAEVEQLRALAAGLQSGQGCTVVVSGEAGLGKSRLMAEWRAELGERCRWLEGRCFAHTSALAYGPFLDLFRRHAEIRDDDSEADARSRFDAAIERLFPGDLEARALFASLLALTPTPAESEVLADLRAEAFRERLFARLQEMFAGLAGRRPTLLVLEDFHWADVASMELVERLLPLARRLPLAVVLVARLRPGESGAGLLELARKHCPERAVHIALAPLAGAASEAMLRGLLPTADLPTPLRNLILSKAEGNPFFVEEMLRSLIERGAFVRADDGQWVATALMESVSVPDTLQGLLMARLDRLPADCRWVVQQASVIGRIFLYRVLAHMAERDAEMNTHLGYLEQVELIRERARQPEVEYIFKHGLTQEVAYQSLLAPRRKELHRRVGETLESLFAARLGELYSILAEHFWRGEDWEKAAHYLARAGEAARGLHALAEARLHFARAAEAFARLPPTSDNRRGQVDVAIGLVSVSFGTEAPETNLARLAEAESWLESLSAPDSPIPEADRLRQARIHYWMGRSYFYQNQPLRAVDYYRRVLAVAQESGDEELLAIPSSTIGRALMGQGRFGQATPLLAQAVAPLERAGNWPEWVLTRAYLGGALAAGGQYQAGLTECRRALERALESNNRGGAAASRIILGFAYFHGRQVPEMLRESQAAAQTARASGDRLYVYFASGFCAWAETHLGRHEAAAASMAHCDEVGRSLGGRLLVADWFAAIKAEMARAAGRPAEAAALAEQAIQVASAVGGLFATGMARRTWGMALAALQPRSPGQVESQLLASLEAFESGQCRLEAARTRAALGDLCRVLRRRPQAAEHYRLALAQFQASGLQTEAARMRILLGTTES